MAKALLLLLFAALAPANVQGFSLSTARCRSSSSLTMAASSLSSSPPPSTTRRTAIAAGVGFLGLGGAGGGFRPASAAAAAAAGGLQEVEDTVLGNTGDMDEFVEDKRQLIIDYNIREEGFEGPIVETSKDPLRQPLLFTVGTGAVNPALDEMVRTMRPGGTRRAKVPASYNLIPGKDAYLTIRLRAIKGPSSFNICVVPLPTRKGRADKGLLCQEGARPDAP